MVEHVREDRQPHILQPESSAGEAQGQVGA